MNDNGMQKATILGKEKNAIETRVDLMDKRVQRGKDRGVYAFMQVSDKVDGIHLEVDGRPMIQFSSYSYLDLNGHPRIQEAAKKSLEEFGTGTHGVRFLAGTLRVHIELEQTIARFKQTEEAMTLPSGYAANLGTLAALLNRNDIVISDKLNHASIVDGCRISGAEIKRFDHNDMEALERALAESPEEATKLIVTDAVFSMDGDIINLPEMVRLKKKYDAMLMVDEAHSLGVLGETGHGIEEYFGMVDPEAIDVKMGTMSKAIPSVGGYIAGSRKLINYLKHTVRPFIFSAALPPASAAAAKAAFEVIESEPERVKKLRLNTEYFISGLKKRGFNTLNTKTPIVPIVVGHEYNTYTMTRIAAEEGIFAVPVIAPAVPAGTDRIRATVTAGHSIPDIDRALGVFEKAGKQVGVLF